MQTQQATLWIPALDRDRVRAQLGLDLEQAQALAAAPYPQGIDPDRLVAQVQRELAAQPQALATVAAWEEPEFGLTAQEMAERLVKRAMPDLEKLQEMLPAAPAEADPEQVAKARQILQARGLWQILLAWS